MRVLIALAAATAVTGCGAAAPTPPPDFTAPDKLLSCSVKLPDDWKNKLAAGETRAGETEQVTIVAANENADTTLVRTKRDKTTELVLRDSKRRQQVMAVQDQAQIFDVEFDGRWVTFSTTPHPENHAVTTYAWDSRKDGAPVRIGSEIAVVRGGKAAWSAGSEVHLFDLATRKDRVVGTGKAPVFLGDQLLWSEGGKFRAVGLDGAEVAAPQQLSAAAPDTVVSDGRTAVWTQGGALYGWRAGWPEQRKLAEIRTTGGDSSSSGGQGIVFPRVSGDLVSWSAETPYVTDIRSGSTVYITKTSDFYEVRGGALTRKGWKTAAATPVSGLSPLPAC